MQLVVLFALASAGDALKITHGRIAKPLDAEEGWDMDEWQKQVEDEIQRMSSLKLFKVPRDDQKELPIQKSCSSNSNYDIAAARTKMEDKAKAAVDATSSITEPDHADWLIVDGKVYVREDATWDILNPHKLGSDEPAAHKVPTKKKEHMKNLINSVIEASCDGIEDVAFNFDETSTGGSKVASKGPTLAIAAMKGRNTTNEILVPNLYFGDIYQWEKWVQGFKRHDSNVDWAAKKEQAFWRGMSTSYGKCDHPGNKERLEASTLTKEAPEDFDIAVTNHNNLDCMNGQVEQRKKTKGRESMAEWKYLVNLPGSQAGSYSRNINHLFLMNSVVMMWETNPGTGLEYDEWYFPALKEGETHLNINMENAKKVLKDLKADDAKAKAMAETSCSVFEAAFSPCALTKSFQNVFKLLKSKQDRDGSVSPKELLKAGDYKLLTSGEKRSCTCKGYDRV